MLELFTLWWAWVVAGFVIAIFEIFLPGFIFVGFAFGAIITGLLIGIGILATAGLPFVFLIFAVLSLLAWIVLRAVMGKRQGQVKTWDRDINDHP